MNISGIFEKHRNLRADCIRATPAMLFIDGKLCSGSGKETTVRDATTGELLLQYQSADVSNVKTAIDVADSSTNKWAQLPPDDRAEMLFDAADLLRDSITDIATIEALETGRQLDDARTHTLSEAVGLLEYYAEIADEQSDEIENSLSESDTANPVGRLEPYGVVGAIASANGQLSHIGRKLAPALAAGNTVVYKTSRNATLAARAAVCVIDQALPDGVVNLVPGSAEATEAILTEQTVRKVSHTGSIETGKEIMKVGAETVTDIHLALGGNSCGVVFPDADLESAGQHLSLGAFDRAGQTGISISRLFVHQSVFEPFVTALVTATERYFSPGDPLDPDTTYPPLMNDEFLKEVQQAVDAAKQVGGTIRTGGDQITIPEFNPATFYEPTVISGLSPSEPTVRHEVFGPLLQVFSWNEYDKLIELINDTEYGLAASVWTNDTTKAEAITADIDAGTIWVNKHGDLTSQMPFGGFKQSGIGNERGVRGIREFQRLKVVDSELA
jgi:aldehyde dehydrogenase (NAD+)